MIILPINAILQGQSYTRPQVDAALALKQNVLTFDDMPTDSNNPVKSRGIKTALDGKLPIAENQEQAPVGYVLTKTSTGAQWQRASSEGGTIAAAANSYPVTLTVANWSNNQYVIPTPVGATLTTDSDGILGLASNASKAQVEAFQLAKIVVSSQDANGITIIARGQVPTIALNLELTVFMKADYYTTTQADALFATKAPLASPVFTGTPTAPTAASGTNTTQVATTAFVADAITGVESDLASIHATGSNNTTGAPIQPSTYFYLNGSLVQAKENIGTGAPFTISNYAAVTDGGLNELNAALPHVYSLGNGASATFAANMGCLILVLRNSVAIEALYTVDILGAVIRLVGSATGHSISYANGQATVSNSSGVVITVSLFNTFT